MTRHYSLLLTAGLLAVTHTAVMAATDPFMEQNGKLVVEIESGDAEGDWSVEDGIYGHTGTGYLVWKGQNNYGESQAPRGNPIRYHFRISTPGNYELRWRSRNTQGLDATEHNDSWVRFPTGTNIDDQHPLSGWTKAYMGQVAQWTWDAYTVDHDNQLIRQYFDAGDHYIEIAGRSYAHGLDRFALYRYESGGLNKTEFDALPESPRASQAQRPAHPYTGNSCVADTLSLAANTVISNDTSVTTTGQVDPQIFVNSSPDYALLKFDVPNNADITNSSLKLANSASQALQLSVYLGSHSNWNESTAAQDLPDPSTLLGTVEATAEQHAIASMNIVSSMLPEERVTLILNTDPGQTQSLHGLGTRSEPRLELQVPSEFCDAYNLRKTSGDNTATGGDTTDSNAGSDVTEGSGSNEEGGTDTSNPTDNNTADNTDAEQPVDVQDNADRGTGDDNVIEATQNKKRGGSVSFWALLALAGFARITRRGTPQRWWLVNATK